MEGVNTFSAWLLAARPKTLVAAALPVCCALTLAVGDLGDGGALLVPAAVLCLLFAVILQVGANYINDYFDYLNGIDGEERSGPRRACAMGWITPRAMRLGIAATVAAACLCGLPLVVYGGMEMLLIGALCVIFCFLYTTHLSYMGLGDLLVLVFFGVVPVCVVYYIQLHSVSCEAVLLSIGSGLLVDTLLLVNNCRDYATDRRCGKNTLVVRIGREGGCRLYLLAGVVGSVIVCTVMASLLWSCSLRLPGVVVAAALAIALVARYAGVYRSMSSAPEGSAMERELTTTSANMLLTLVVTVAFGVVGYLI